MKWLLFPLAFFISTSTAFAQSQLYRLDVKSKMCLPVDDKSLKPRPATAVQDFPQIDQEFLNNNPVCNFSCSQNDAEGNCAKPAQRLTCLTGDRLFSLLWDDALPRAPESSYLTTSPRYQEKVKKACMRSAVDKSIHSFSDVNRLMTKEYKAYPIETKMVSDITQKTKDLVKQDVADSRLAMDALEKCLQYDVARFPENLSPAEKIKRYQSEPAKAGVPPHCDQLWKQDSKLADLPEQLALMRVSLFAAQYLDKKGNDVASLAKLATDLEEGRPLDAGQKQNLQARLKHRKGETFGSSDVFWENTPDSLPPLTPAEAKALKAYVFGIKDFYGHDNLKEAIEFQYSQTVSQSPILVRFESANPNPREVLKAFQQHKGKMNSIFETSSDDIDFLKHRVYLEAALNSEDPALVGDYCVLLAHIVSKSDAHYQAPAVLLGGYAMLAGGVAGVTAGLAKRSVFAGIWGFITAAAGAKTALFVIQTAKAARVREQMRSQCSSTYVNSNDLCDLSKLNAAHSDLVINTGLAVTFAGMPLSGRAAGITKAFLQKYRQSQ